LEKNLHFEYGAFMPVFSYVARAVKGSKAQLKLAFIIEQR
jgi:hypothetical protein